MRQLFGTLLLLAAGLVACEKNTLAVEDLTATGGRIKFIHAGVGLPAVNFFVNDAKVSGVSSTATGVVQGSAYGGSFPQVEYATVPVGSLTLKAASRTAAAADSTIATATLTTEADKYYTAILAGRPGQFFTLTDDFSSASDASKAYVRFVNAVSDTARYDIYSRSDTAYVARNLSFRQSTAFLPVNPMSTVYEFRRAGSTALLGTALTVNDYVSGRVFTVVMRGTPGTTATTTVPALSLYRNR